MVKVPISGISFPQLLLPYNHPSLLGIATGALGGAAFKRSPPPTALSSIPPPRRSPSPPPVSLRPRSDGTARRTTR